MYFINITTICSKDTFSIRCIILLLDVIYARIQLDNAAQSTTVSKHNVAPGKYCKIMDYYTIPNIILIITLLVVPSCVSMPNGPPESACQDMRPRSRMGEVHIEGHTTMPQNILPTYGRKRQPPFYFQIHLNKTGPLKDRFEYYPDVPIAGVNTTP